MGLPCHIFPALALWAVNHSYLNNLVCLRKSYICVYFHGDLLLWDTVR